MNDKTKKRRNSMEINDLIKEKKYKFYKKEGAYKFDKIRQKLMKVKYLFS